MKTFTDIPMQRPATPLLDRIDSPDALRQLPQAQLPRLADELRHFLLYSVGQSGGHFSAGLGVVELTLALHYVYHTPEDRLIWDVGHQAYPHKIITGRREHMHSIRQQQGLSGFPKRSESPFDAFGVGHSSTSISAALGMALAGRCLGDERPIVAVIGDGALTAGQAFEALSHAGHEKANLLVVLNDNDMSISQNIGGLSTYLAQIFASRTYTHIREGGKRVLKNFMPPMQALARRAEEHVKGMVAPGTLFEELGFNYIGPVDGHDVIGLCHLLSKLRSYEGPQLLHIATQKGCGFLPAEKDPIAYHAISKQTAAPIDPASADLSACPKYANVFGQWLCDMAQQDHRLIGITPAMCEGSDLVAFAQRFPQRYFDVAIAEQHALTLAAGLACEGAKPVVAIYSTFLQRAYDQLIHDIAIQNLDVLLAIDRAGLVGEDGATHAGSFDLSYLRCIPNLVIMAPKDENETRQMLYTGYHYPGPAAVRYPRGQGPGAAIDAAMTALPLGQAQWLRRGQRLAILAFGTAVNWVGDLAEQLQATLVNMRFIKPLDGAAITELAHSHDLLVSVEDNAIAGGAGSAVLEYLAQQGQTIPCLLLGLPDLFLDQGSVMQQRQMAGVDTAQLRQRILQRMRQLALPCPD